jgi:hypothetical protein
MKFFPRCEQWKHLADFPRDRCRPDGRWHTCKRCHVERQRFRRAEVRELKKQALLYSLPPPPAPRSRLHTLTKAYRKTSGPGLPFDHLPPDEKFNARQIVNKSVARHGPRISQPKYALRRANAASNARRVGNSFWGRSMRAKKGWRTRREREFWELLHQANMRALSGQTPQGNETGACWASVSRLWGI